MVGGVLSLLSPARARRGDLGRRHQIADVLLQELIVAIQLIMLLPHGLDAIEDLEEGLMEALRVSAEAWVISISLDWNRIGVEIGLSATDGLTATTVLAPPGSSSLDRRSCAAATWRAHRRRRTPRRHSAARRSARRGR